MNCRSCQSKMVLLFTSYVCDVCNPPGGVNANTPQSPTYSHKICAQLIVDLFYKDCQKNLSFQRVIGALYKDGSLPSQEEIRILIEGDHCGAVPDSLRTKFPNLDALLDTNPLL